jgi:hypothetical protein
VIEMSVRCEYCAGCDHLTVECLGLRHDIPPVRAFKEPHFGAIGATSAPACSRCNQPEHPGRRLHQVYCEFADGNRYVCLCGDCAAGGIPLAAQPVTEPGRINYHAGETPDYEWVGSL